jgi:hypothetical protein
MYLFSWAYCPGQLLDLKNSDTAGRFSCSIDRETLIDRQSVAESDAAGVRDGPTVVRDGHATSYDTISSCFMLFSVGR